MLRVASLCLACAVLACFGAACRNGIAATVGKDVVMTAQLNRELSAVRNNAGYMRTLEKRSGLPMGVQRGPFAAAFAAEVLSNKIRFIAAQHIARSRHLVIRPADVGPGPALLDAETVSGNPKNFDAFPKWYRDELVLRSATSIRLKELLQSDVRPEDWYRTHKSDYVRACEWDIVTKARNDAVVARNRILAGESFQAVAREVSIDRGVRSKGGSLGCNEPKSLLPALDKIAFSLPIGMVSDVIPVDQLFHVVMVTGREAPPLGNIQGEVKAAIDDLGAQRFASAMRAQLASADISVARRFGTWDKNELRVTPPTARAQPAFGPYRSPPVARSSKDVDPVFNRGQQIFITDGGFRPVQLVALAGAPITWINETHQQQVVVLLIGGTPQVGPIEPGGGASYTPESSIAIAYTLLTHSTVRGGIQVEPPHD